MQKMMKDMQKLQGKMTQLQSELEQKTFSAEAGGGMVQLEMSGKYDLLSVRLNKEVVDPDDIEALEDLIVAAYNNAKTQVDTESQAIMGGLKSGLKIPGM